MRTALDLTTLIEKEWDAFLFGAGKGVATTLGWVSYHTLRSKGSASGFPDRTCWRERLLFAELKTEANKPSDRQVEFMIGMANAGVEVYLWRPSDYPEAVNVLGTRSKFDAHAGTLTSPTLGTWKPRSLWLADGERRDVIEAA
jgi:hypothetical protein